MLSRQKADFSIISTYSHQSGMNRSKKQIIGNAGKKGLCQSISISRKKTCCHGLPGTLAEHGKGQRDKDASYSPTQAFEPSRPVDLPSSPNSENEEEIAEAYEWLVKYNENVVAYGNAEQNLTNGTASVALTYDGNTSWAMAEMGENNTLVVADPFDDAVQLGFDLYVIPTGAQHTDLAYKFLNYICDPEVMAKNLEEYPYSCPNDAAVAAASESYRNDPARNFSYKENVFFQEDVGDALTIYNDYYQKLKVGQ